MKKKIEADMSRNKRVNQADKPEQENPKGNTADRIDAVGGNGKPTEGEPQKKVYRRRQKQPEPLPVVFTDEQMGNMTTGLFLVLKGLTKLPFDQADPDQKKAFDMALANVANQYGGEVLQKWAPLAQLAVCASLLTVDVIQKKRQADRKDKPNEQPES